MGVHVARTGTVTNAYKNLVGEIKEDETWQT
jgi:hypothetical protein